MRIRDLSPGGVLVRVEWSGVNYKDALATMPEGNVSRISPLVPGIDLAGTIVDPGASSYDVDTHVIAHGYGLGVTHHGGYAEYCRLPAEWLVPLPHGLSPRDAMSLGTAGFAAALAVSRLEGHGLRPATGPVLVTGSSGGVGSVAIGILAARGYYVVASTRKVDAGDWLRFLGAAEVHNRLDISNEARPLEHERWAGAVDCVGGETLAAVLRTLRYGAAVAVTGIAGGSDIPGSVLPFILRSVSMVGVDTTMCEMDLRREIWSRLGDDLRPTVVKDLATSEIGLAEIPEALDRIRAGRVVGRILVNLAGE